MDFIEQLRTIAARIPNLKDAIKNNEQATKQALILPFIQALGYDTSDPSEVWPEFTADIGVKKGEKVDYAIHNSNGIPIILFECKSADADLNHEEKHTQLFRYFAVTKARFAVLTNGIIYRFFTDLEEKNKMDPKPFLELSMLDIKEDIVKEVKRFTKTSFDVDQLEPVAKELRYIREIQRILGKEFDSPSEGLVKLLATQVYSKNINQKILEQFTVFTKRAFQQFIDDKLEERFKSAMAKKGTEGQKPQDESVSSEQEAFASADNKNGKTALTGEKYEAYCIIKAILWKEIDPNRLVWRDFKNHGGVLLDNNQRQPICKLEFNGLTKSISVCDGTNKEPEQIQDLNDIFKFSGKLKASVASYEPEPVKAGKSG